MKINYQTRVQIGHLTPKNVVLVMISSLQGSGRIVIYDYYHFSITKNLVVGLPAIRQKH